MSEVALIQSEKLTFIKEHLTKLKMEPATRSNKNKIDSIQKVLDLVEKNNKKKADEFAKRASKRKQVVNKLSLNPEYGIDMIDLDDVHDWEWSEKQNKASLNKLKLASLKSRPGPQFILVNAPAGRVNDYSGEQVISLKVKEPEGSYRFVASDQNSDTMPAYKVQWNEDEVISTVSKNSRDSIDTSQLDVLKRDDDPRYIVVPTEIQPIDSLIRNSNK
jgi:hypothetical protein